MCGIVGYLGKKRNVDFVIKKLKMLEYRSYDSSGVAVKNDDGISIFREVGGIKNLEEKLPKNKEMTLAIAHTRWATHGKPSEINSHPHSSKNGEWIVVHNGIIENYLELKNELKETIESETDTAVLTEFLEEKNVKTMDEFIEFFDGVRGSFAIAAINKQQTDKLFFAKRKSPLYVAEVDGDVLVASDPICFSGMTRNYYIVYDGEFGFAQNGKAHFYDKTKHEIFKKTTYLESGFEDAQKMQYGHFMLKEIMEQRVALERQVDVFCQQKVLEKFDDKFFKQFDNVQFIGCGTAYHAALMGSAMFRKILHKKADAQIASEFIYNEPIFADEKSLFIFVSQSGETADTIEAMKLAASKGACTIALTNVLYSTLAQNSDYVIPVCAGPEIAVASTKAYVCQLSAIFMLAKNIENSVSNLDYDYFDAIKKLAKKILNIDFKKIENLASEIKNQTAPIFIGKGLDAITAKEASLKLKEVAYINSTDYPSGELKHGFLALVESETPLFVFATQKNVISKSLNSASEAASRGAKVIAISNQEINGLTEFFIDEPDEILASILAIVPMQYLAYQVSIQKGINPDKPRNLAKSVTVE